MFTPMNLTRWTRYQVERWMLRGAPAFLSVLVLLLATLALSGGLIAFYLPGDRFETFPQALWWAVLRLSDTGYLSDDIPDIRVRVLSVVLSLLGMAVSVGGIVALVSQSMNGLLRQLSEATTPVPFRGHIVLLGWTDRTPRLLDGLLRASKRKIVVLLEEVGPKEQRRLHRALPNTAHLERVVLRRGNLGRKEDLARGACADAHVIVLAAAGAATAGDVEAGPRILKTLLNLKTLFSKSRGQPPLVVVEVIDRDLIRLVEATVPHVRVLHSDRLISRSLRIGLQAPDMVTEAPNIVRPHDDWLHEIVSSEEHEGLLVHEIPEPEGPTRLIGLMRSQEAGSTLHVSLTDKVCAGDELVYLTAPPLAVLGEEEVVPQELDPLLRRGCWKVLILGWSEVVPDLFAELCMEDEDRYEVDIVSLVPTTLREAALARINQKERVKVTHHVGDPSHLHSAPGVQIEDFDRFLVVSDRNGAPETADARTLAAVLELDRHRQKFKKDAFITVELLEPEDLEIVNRVDEVVTPQLVADVLVSLVLSMDSHVNLSQTLRLQTTFVSRVIDLPSGCKWSLPSLRRALRARGLTLLHIYPPSASRNHPRLLIAEPVLSPAPPPASNVYRVT